MDGQGSNGEARRVFLGWDEPALMSAARWLAERGPDLSGLIVALPGRRAARRLEELLAAAMPDDGPWSPPEMLTAGHLTDRLVQGARPSASRLVRTFLWAAALDDVGPERLVTLAPAVSGAGPRPDLLVLAEELRELHGALARDDLDFEPVREEVARHPGGREAARWKTLAAVAGIYCDHLRELGLDDPHDARRAALDAGRIDTEARVVLVGVADLPGLLRRALGALGDRVTALVFAPQDRADGFDTLGGVRVPFWLEADVPLADEHWRVADKPEHQADAVVDVMAGWGGAFAASDITIGVPDAQVTPYVERRLEAARIATRRAAGTPTRRTPLFALIRALADWLEDWRYEGFAALVRHPDVEEALEHGGHVEADDQVASCLDAYHAEHLPLCIEPDRLARGDVDPDFDRDRIHARLVRAHAGVKVLVGDVLLAVGSPAGDGIACGVWAEALLGVLGRVYGHRELDPDDEADADLMRVLEQVRDVVEELAALPAGSEAKMTAAEALRLVLRTLGGESVAPPPRDDAVELLGWLELALDDARALIVTGFNEGRVPTSVQGHAFLPDGLRQRLGMADNDQRFARDVYALSAMIPSRERLHLIGGRRNDDGDPLRPSRLLFQHADDEIVVERVRRFLDRPPEPPVAPAVTDSGPRGERQTFEPWTGDVLSVTAFKTWLQSPREFYFKHVLRLRSVDDGDREMNPPAFGDVAHKALAHFGRNPEARELDDAEAIADYLDDRVRRLLLAIYGKDPQPAIRIQQRQMQYRLRAFARWQARRRREGWRIVEAEWEPPEGGTVELPGVAEPLLIKGKIDRIDRHDDHGWAILDYKTGENGDDPESTHRAGPKSRRRWVDLQLPLYRLLAHEICGDDPALGYVVLPKQADECGDRMAAWSAEELVEAEATARHVVASIRTGAFSEVGKSLRPEYDPILCALAGIGVLRSGRAP